MPNHEQLQRLKGKRTHVFSSDGQKIGILGRIFIDKGTLQPNFISVHTGLFGSGEHLVPVENSEISDSQLHVVYTKHVVKGAPKVASAEPLGTAAERELYNYYAQPNTVRDQSKHRGIHAGSQRATAAGLGTPMIAEELTRQDSKVPEESRMLLVGNEADPDLRFADDPDFHSSEQNPNRGTP